jgi:hypothetical protein
MGSTLGLGRRVRNLSVLARTMTIPVPAPFVIPSVSLLIRIDGIGGALQGSLAKLPALVAGPSGMGVSPMARGLPSSADRGRPTSWPAFHSEGIS